MYVDKPLSGIKAVQTLSRLNRAHPEKHDVFVLDFQNSVEAITEAFSDYYRTTVLSEETDPNKLHDLKNSLDSAQVYSPNRKRRLCTWQSTFADPVGNGREKMHPIHAFNGKFFYGALSSSEETQRSLLMPLTHLQRRA